MNTRTFAEMNITIEENRSPCWSRITGKVIEIAVIGKISHKIRTT